MGRGDSKKKPKLGRLGRFLNKEMSRHSGLSGSERSALREQLKYQWRFEKLQKQMMEQQHALLASIPKPTPPAPPATAGSSSVQGALDAQRRLNLRRRGLNSTTVAGETGGFGLSAGLPS